MKSKPLAGARELSGSEQLTMASDRIKLGSWMDYLLWYFGKILNFLSVCLLLCKKGIAMLPTLEHCG